MESSAIYYCCWQAMAFCPLDGLFHNKGAPHSHAHIQTLMIMVDLGESKLSHTFIATSCPFQLCYRNWHVKMSKWSWQLWWWAIWGKWDQNNDEVADDVDADDINVCKAISFLDRGKNWCASNYTKKLLWWKFICLMKRKEREQAGTWSHLWSTDRRGEEWHS